MQGLVLEFDPPRRLAFIWSPGGKVAFDLEPMGDKVIKLRSGLVEQVQINESPLSVEDLEW